jgi:hypothetical protein
VAEHEVPVGHVPQRRDNIAAQPRDLARQEHDRVDERDHEQQIHRGEQPAGAPEPEILEVYATPLPPFRQQQRGDEVSADDEEDLDAEEAARDPGQLGMVEEHRDNGERAQPVETGRVRQPHALFPPPIATGVGRADKTACRRPSALQSGARPVAQRAERACPPPSHRGSE